MTSDEDPGPERRGSDEHTRQIVKMTVHEIFDGVGVDFSTPEGRKQFRDNVAFLDDARSGTGAAKKGLFTVMVTGAAYGVWKLVVVMAR